jgi:hypothetical protein
VQALANIRKRDRDTKMFFFIGYVFVKNNGGLLKKILSLLDHHGHFMHSRFTVVPAGVSHYKRGSIVAGVRINIIV